MTNHKERILNLVKEGILTNEEAIILLENRAKQAESNPTTQTQVEEEKDILDDFYADWKNDQAVNQDDITGRTEKVAIQKDQDHQKRRYKQIQKLTKASRLKKKLKKMLTTTKISLATSSLKHGQF